MKYIYIFTFLLILFSCNERNNNDKITKEKTLQEVIQAERDSLIKDSLNTLSIIKNLKKNKVVNVDSIRVQLIDKSKFVNKLKTDFEYTSYSTYFREHTAEKDERILYLKIKLSTDLKPLNPENFFPKINVFEYLDKKNNIQFYGDMTYALINKTNLNIVYLEQIFNYRNSENFICFINIPKDRKGKLIITADNGHKFNNSNVIDIIVN
ncbi:hypothetical protein ACTS95_11995 [Empedobacter brevis]